MMSKISSSSVFNIYDTYRPELKPKMELVSYLSIQPYIISMSILFSLVLLASCSKEPQQLTYDTNVSHNLDSTTPAIHTHNQAKSLFIKRCSRCHGTKGNGQGPFADQLNPPPTDLTSHTWFQQTNLKKIKRVILGGGRAIGKSAMMPSHPDLRNKPKLLNDLIQYVINIAPRSPTISE